MGTTRPWANTDFGSDKLPRTVPPEKRAIKSREKEGWTDTTVLRTRWPRVLLDFFITFVTPPSSPSPLGQHRRRENACRVPTEPGSLVFNVINGSRLNKAVECTKTHSRPTFGEDRVRGNTFRHRSLEVVGGKDGLRLDRQLGPHGEPLRTNTARRVYKCDRLANAIGPLRRSWR